MTTTAVPLVLFVLLMAHNSVHASHMHSDAYKSAPTEAQTVAPICTDMQRRCPTFRKIYSDAAGRRFDIRSYDAATWLTALPSPSSLSSSSSCGDATKDGFLKLAHHIRGRGAAVTAPLLTDVFSAHEFNVSLPLPPNVSSPSDGADVVLSCRGPAYVAVRRFPGPATSAAVLTEARRLRTELARSRWSATVATRPRVPAFSLVQYNLPLVNDSGAGEHVNEIWIRLKLKGRHHHNDSSPSPSPSPSPPLSPAPAPSITEAPSPSTSPLRDLSSSSYFSGKASSSSSSLSSRKERVPSPSPSVSPSPSTLTSPKVPWFPFPRPQPRMRWPQNPPPPNWLGDSVGDGAGLAPSRPRLHGWLQRQRAHPVVQRPGPRWFPTKPFPAVMPPLDLLDSP